MEAVETAESLDPRVRRTRQMLQDALERLLGSKSIEDISVGDIAEKATLNRATFYDHYSDKFELLEGLVESRFQELLDKRRLAFDGSCPAALSSIILAVCDYLDSLPEGDCRSPFLMEKHLGSAMVSVLRRLMLSGCRKHAQKPGIAPELVAATMSGAIYNAAREWARTPNRPPADEVVKSISALVVPMLA